jgi:type IV secretion system protein VirD4
LTPGEVTQLPDDEAILMVGSLLPYRAKKVRYFIDPRFRARAGLPPPDATSEQARELPADVPNDWLMPWLGARAAIALAQRDGAASWAGRASEVQPETEPPATAAIWDAFFASEPSASTNEERDVSSEATDEAADA